MSGPGEVAILWSNAQGGALRLGNFDIGKHRPKREHIEDGLRLPALKTGGSARIVGLTSRTGSFGYNLALSRRRADAVIAELRIQLGAAPRVASDTGAGESVAWLAGVPDGTEHPSWRSVIVVYSSQPDLQPLPRLGLIGPSLRFWPTQRTLVNRKCRIFRDHVSDRRRRKTCDTVIDGRLTHGTLNLAA